MDGVPKRAPHTIVTLIVRLGEERAHYTLMQVSLKRLVALKIWA